MTAGFWMCRTGNHWIAIFGAKTVDSTSKIDFQAIHITTWGTVFLEKSIGAQLVKKLPSLYGTFSTVFTKASHWTQSWGSSVQCTCSQPVSPRPIICLAVILPRSLFRSDYQVMLLQITNLHHACYFFRPSYPP
jgi:hypothetical protein